MRAPIASSLADTVGYADPVTVRAAVRAGARIAGDRLCCGHFHDTRGLALANVFAALADRRRALRRVARRHRRLPACAGRERQRASEDLAFMLASMGVAPASTSSALLALRGECRRLARRRDAARHAVARRPAEDVRTCGSERRHATTHGDARPNAISTTSARRSRALPLAGIARRRVHAHGDGADVRHDPRRPRRRGHQGRADRRRQARAGCSARASASSACSTATRRASRSTSDSRRAREVARKLRRERRRRRRELQARHDEQATASTTRRCRRRTRGSSTSRTRASCPGPYEHRTALDEVVQMMGGLAYMTGPAGRSAARGHQRQRHHGRHVRRDRRAGRADRSAASPGEGRKCRAALFENNVFLVGQHMLQYAMTGKPPSPMPARDLAVGRLRRVHA